MKPKIQPTPVSTEVPAPAVSEKLPAFDRKASPDDKIGTGVPQQYKDTANQSANVMWRAKIKGRKLLADTIPLHVSLKTFDKPEAMPIDEIHSKVKELGLERPDPSKLKFEPTTFTSPRTGKTYYMLKLHGTDPAYQKFNDHFKGQGITHDKFFGHVTVDKELHDQIQKEGIQPHEVEFSPLMIEHGANNPTHLFPDSQSHKDHSDDITPKKLNPMPVKKTEEQVGEVLMKPYRSEAQRRWAHTANGKEALGGDAAVHEWDEATKGKKLPEKLEKGALKNMGAAAAMVGALSGSPNMAHAPNQPAQSYSSDRMLQAISQVESSGGQNTKHAAIPGNMHHGEHALGSFGLTPVVIRETVKMNPQLKREHPKALHLRGQDMAHYLQDNPGLEQKLAANHLHRLEHHFGNDPAKIGMSWLDGITGTKQKLKQGFNPNTHWHARKVLDAYSKGK